MRESAPVVRLLAVLEEAALASWRRKPMTAAAVVAISLTLVFPALTLVSLDWVSRFLDELASRDRVRVFLAADAGPADVQAVHDLLAQAAGVTEVEDLGPDQARQRFLELFPELAPVADSLTPDDLSFPASIEFHLAGGSELPAALAASLAAARGVEEVRQDIGWSRQLQRLRAACATAAALTAVIALAITGFGIGNVVALSALARREELATMRLVGAPAVHLRVPYWLEGAAQGAAGGFLAALVVSAVIHVVAEAIATVLPTAAAGLPPGAITLLILAPAVTGALGGAIAVEAVLRRHARLER